MKTYKTLKKKIEDISRKSSYVHGFSELILGKELNYKKNSTDCNNLHKNIDVTLYKNGTINPRIHMKAQKTPNIQSNPEQKEQC
jgi:hypothetical protein